MNYGRLLSAYRGSWFQAYTEIRNKHCKIIDFFYFYDIALLILLFASGGITIPALES